MRKRYTRQQIQEAISFWKAILENKSSLLDDLVDEHGYGIVFHNVPVIVSLKLIESLFTAINKHVFSSMLMKWPFVVDDKACDLANALCGYVPDLISNPEKQQYEVVLKNVMIDGMLFVPPHYAFSSKLVNGAECSLILVASLLAHEMIHQFNFECEDECKIHRLDDAYHRKYDEHGKNFERWMNIMNDKHGLNVEKSGKGRISDLSINAHNALKKFAGNDYSSNLNEEEVRHGHQMLKHTRDFSAFTMFI